MYTRIGESKMNTEKLICNTLIDMMEEKPFTQIKITQLTERCHISRPTFYTYFDSIYDAIQYIEDELISQIYVEDLMILYDNSEKLNEGFAVFRSHLKTFKVLCGPNGDPCFNAKLENRNKKMLLKFAKSKNTKLTETQLDIINEYTKAGKQKALLWWADHEDEVSAKEVFEMLKLIQNIIHKII